MNFEVQLFEDKQRGMMAALAKDSHISKWCIDQQSIVSDQTVPLHILPLFKEGDTVVDVGAFIGDHTIAYGERVGSNGHVLAFEPYLPAFACLRFNDRLFAQIHAINCALGFDRKSVNLLVPEHGNMGMVSVDSENGLTQVLRLDDWQLSACHFIKIDAEGYEPEVIKGAMETITKFKPIMYIELNDAALAVYGYTKKDILDGLKLIGYEHEFVDPKHTLDLPQVDVILRPK